MFTQLKNEEGLKAAKFLKHQFFIETKALRQFFEKFPNIQYIPIGKIFLPKEKLPTIENFFLVVQEYEDRLCSENVPIVHDLRINLSGAFSLTNDAFGVQILEGNKRLFKPILPVMQFQLSSFFVGIDKKIHFAFGKEVTYIGLQVLFPQLFISSNQEIKNGLKSTDSPNAELFKSFVSYLRDHTQLISFAIGDTLIKSTIRLSPEIFEQIKKIPRFHQIRMPSC